MKVGVFTPLLSQLPLDSVLAKLEKLDIHTVELSTGNYPGNAHCKLSMLDDPPALDEFKSTLADHGESISALSCHGNPLHPDPQHAKDAQEVNRKTILLAEKLGVPAVVDFSGCPGDSPGAKHPNWVTCPWPPDYLDVLKWQWDEVVAPYWTQHAKFAAEHGVKIAIEMHPGFVVYSPETMQKLRTIAGPSVGCNFDPSHLFWQQIDPIAAIRILGDAIFHVHAKDTQMYPANLNATGVLDTKPYTHERQRGWIFRTCGYGHGEPSWREFISTLRMFGYDNVLSIAPCVRHAAFHRPAITGPTGALLVDVVRYIAHYPIRLRGTFCGSLAHADPASEWCLTAVTLGAELVALSSRGRRTIAADDYFQGMMTTTLAEDELITEVRVPLLSEDARFGFDEFNRRAGDYALAMALATFCLRDGVIVEPRVGLGGAEARPRRIAKAEAVLAGQEPSVEVFDAAGEAAASAVDPLEDVHADAEFRRDLVSTVTQRALARAAA